MKPVDILETAASLVGGDRAQQYGDYTVLHQRVADLWGVYLKTEIKPEDVAFCMALLKVARNEVGQTKSDNGIDASAYVALWAAISEDKNHA
jgi:hypothetical protein|tara:strand:+ start:1398 stop:1673 length:276 start_codon:yes stop_codon:yes gene_type:complete